MKCTKYILLIFFVASCFQTLRAQEVFTSTNSRKALQYYVQSEELLMNKRYSQAIVVLNKALSYDSAYIDAAMRLSSIYYRVGKDHKEKVMLESVLRQRPDYPNAYFNYGYWNMRHGEYIKAITYFKKFVGFDGVSERFIKKANSNLIICEYRQHWIEHPLHIKLENVGKGINTDQSEYWPALTADDAYLFFTRQILEDSTRKKGYGQMNEDIYISNLKDDEWQNAIPLPGFPNKREINEGAISISPDGTKIYFTICSEDPNFGMGWCDIWYSELKDGKWQKPVNLGEPINTRMKETQPSISFDGRTLYFTSNRKGGMGKLDIWKSEMLPSGKWGEPENLGPAINTRGSEQSPFIHADDKTLYFSADNRLGMGASDLYMAKKNGQGVFDTVIHMGYPINTHQNEFAIFVNARGNKAFYASQIENGEGRMDIYAFTLPEQYRPNPVVYLKGKVVDSETRARLSAHFEVIDLENGELVITASSDSLSGKYLVALPAETDYAISVSKKGYLFYSQNLPISNSFSTSFEHDVELKAIKVGNSTALRNVFFDFDQYTLLPKSKSELNKVIEFMSENPLVKIELGGHTDNRGAAAYNQTLSENRAKVVRNYLISMGKIDPSRITYKGYGLTQPMATNDTEEGRALNRRTELKIIAVK